MCTLMFIAALFIITKNKTIQTSINWQINKIEYIHTMENYSSVKSNKLQTHAILSINLKNTTLSERSQSCKTS